MIKEKHGPFLSDLPEPPEELEITRSEHKIRKGLIEERKPLVEKARSEGCSIVPNEYMISLEKSLFPYAVARGEEGRGKEAVTLEGKTLTTIAKELIETCGGEIKHIHNGSFGFSIVCSDEIILCLADHPWVFNIGRNHFMSLEPFERKSEESFDNNNNKLKPVGGANSTR
jgi:hypothetical protein